MKNPDLKSLQDSHAPANSEPKHFGSGWISGVISTVLGFIGLLAVACFHFPEYLTMPELRALYPVPYIRALLQLILISSFVLGAISIYLRRSKSIGGIGILLTLIAVMFGGSRVPIDGELSNGPFLGLDWFLLNVLAFSLIFVPLEMLFPYRREQPIFREFWKTDLAYFFASHLFIQLVTFLSLRPAVLLFEWATDSTFRTFVGGQHFVVQFIGILIVADLAQYWIHRLFHTIPWLWKFHAVHHSAQTMDWLAGERIHLVDIAVTRAVIYLPIYLIGFSEAALFAYIIYVSLHATFIHSNFRLEIWPIPLLLATPRFHHWHHTSDPSVMDKNFAVHLPIFDRIFGTYHFPKNAWPTHYGVAEADSPPSGFFAQFAHPFRARR